MKEILDSSVHLRAGDDLWLHELTPDDSSEVCGLINKDPNHARFIGESALAHFSDQDKVAFGSVASGDLQFGGRNNAGELVCLLTLHCPDPEVSKRKAEVGIIVDVDHTHRGIATTALKAIEPFVFEGAKGKKTNDGLGRKKIIARVKMDQLVRLADGSAMIEPGNKAASNMLIKAGYRMVGIDSQNHEVIYELRKYKAKRKPSKPVKVT